MYCTSCGKQIADNAAFCPYCGKPTPQGDTLAKLVAAARIGDQDAISALYEKTYSKVYYTVKAMIKDENAVFDIGQDTSVEELFPDERGDNLPEQVIDQKETKRLIHEIIEELPEDHRAAETA